MSIPIPQEKPAFDLPENMNGGGGGAFTDSIKSVFGVIGQASNEAYDVSYNILRLHQLFGGEDMSAVNTTESQQPLEREPITTANISDAKNIFTPTNIGMALGLVGLFLLFGGK